MSEKNDGVEIAAFLLNHLEFTWSVLGFWFVSVAFFMGITAWLKDNSAQGLKHKNESLDERIKQRDERLAAAQKDLATAVASNDELKKQVAELNEQVAAKAPYAEIAATSSAIQSAVQIVDTDLVLAEDAVRNVPFEEGYLQGSYRTHRTVMHISPTPEQQARLDAAKAERNRRVHNQVINFGPDIKRTSERVIHGSEPLPPKSKDGK
jgi:hypothetical protein